MKEVEMPVFAARGLWKQVLAWMLLWSPVVVGASPLHLDLPGSLERARRHSLSLLDRRDEVRAAEHRVLSARARFLPQLKAAARYAHLSYVEPAQIELPFRLPNQPAPEPIVLGEAIEDQYGLRFTLEQPLFTGFALASGLRAAQEGQRLAEARRAIEDAELRVLVEEAYLGVWQAQEQLRVARESVTVLEAHARTTADRRAQGQLTSWEQLKVEARLSGARAQLLQAESGLRLARLSLLNLLGLPDDQEVVLADVAPPRPTETNATDVLIERALAARPELTVARAQAALRRAQATAAWAPMWPQLRAAASYGWENPNLRYFPPERVTRDSWDVAVLLHWTVLDFGATEHAARAASLEADIAARAVHDLEAKIRLDVSRRHLESQGVFARLDAADLAISAAETSLSRAQALCEAGQASCAGVLDAELELTRARAERAQLIAFARMAAVRLGRAIGGSEP